MLPGLTRGMKEVTAHGSRNLEWNAYSIISVYAGEVQPRCGVQYVYCSASMHLYTREQEKEEKKKNK